ncbi:MAG: hypothetical protein OXN83_03855, partial [Oligoflexia bacterium]|nr:hypothetical protein [Oligoflexia bacterium]
PQVRSCIRQKSSHKPGDYCARHVNSTIMNVLEDFLFPYCESSSRYKGYQQCVKGFQQDIRNKNINICQNAFVFPSALCMLNLDGKNFSAYDQISDRQVKMTCKDWDRYNQMLYSFSYFNEEEIPLFTKEEASRYKEFEADPSQIPLGAIIVSQSSDRHGHVEIKTNKELCGRDKNQTCFCSDYCRERERYEWPFKILAVYRWNSQFLEFMAQLFLFNQPLVYD